MPRWAASQQDAAETAKSGAACSFASTGAGVEHGVLGKVIQFTYSAYSYASQEAAMQIISATDLARNTREVLDKVVTGGEVVAIERNHALIAQIGPAERTMTATQALTGLPLPILTAAQGAAWLEDSLQGFDDAVPNPWA